MEIKYIIKEKLEKLKNKIEEEREFNKKLNEEIKEVERKERIKLSKEMAKEKISIKKDKMIEDYKNKLYKKNKGEYFNPFTGTASNKKGDVNFSLIGGFQ